MRRWTIVATALALAGCAHRHGGGAGPMPPAAPHLLAQSITYETGPCFGACPVYSVTIGNDGSGVFVGKRFTAVTGERRFKATPEQFDAFARGIEPYLPGRGERLYRPGSPLCARAATDLPAVDIRRSRSMRGVVTDRLYFYFGCDMEANAKMAEALGNAPDALPIGDLIGPRP